MADVHARSLSRNAFYAGALQFWTIASRFIITPLVIAKLGLAGYGTWTLLFGICAYVSMFDTSFGFAYSKFTAEYDRRGDYEKLSALIGSGIVLIGSVGVLGVGCIWIWRYPILHLLSVPADLIDDASSALLIVSSCLLLRMSVGSVFQILAGLQRIDLQYKLNMLASAIEFGVAFLLLSRGYGLLGLAVGHLCGQVIGTLGGRVLCWRLCPRLHVSPLWASRAGCREIASLGGRFQLLSILNLMVSQGVRMLMAALFGVSVLGIYELANKLLTLGKTASGAIIAPLMPAFANIHAGQDTERWHNLYTLSSKLVAACAMVCMGFLFAFADRVLLMWTGQEVPLAAWTIRVAAGAAVLVLMTGVGTASLRGKGMLRLEMLYAMVGVPATLILLVVAFLWGGYRAMVLAVTIGQVFSAAWFLVAFHRSEGLSLLHYVRVTLLRPALIAGSVTLAAIALRPLADTMTPPWSGRWGVLFEIAAWGFVFSLVAGLGLWYGTFVDHERRRLIGLVLPGQRRVVGPERDRPTMAQL